MADQGDDKPRIIIDSDWKSQAQAEKERLSAQEEARKQSGPSRPAAAGPIGPAPSGPVASRAPAGGPEEEGLPPADFRTLVGSLVTQALLYMGAIPDPESGRGIVAPEYAKHYIDLLSMLEQKTRGNLTAEESSEITEVLHELRMRFVKVAELVTRMEEKRLKEEAAAVRAAINHPGST